MDTGTVKFFSPLNGYGIVTPGDGGPELFFHATECHIARSVRLEGGARVSFDRCATAKGWRAGNVRLLKRAGRCPCCGGVR